MIVTTSNRHQAKLAPIAKQIAKDLEIPFIRRDRFSMEGLMKEYQLEQLLMVTGEELKLFHKGYLDEPFFFHPRSAMFRIKRLIRGETDPFVEAAQLKSGATLLDCTLGLASDAIVASYVCHPASVIGLESSKIISYIVKRGLIAWPTKLEELKEAMSRIEVVHQSYHNYLHKCADNSFDIIYFDPMFERTNPLSKELNPLRKIANYERITEATMTEAKRVAKQRIVIKDSSYSSSFEALGFHPLIRKYASHWYGVMELE